MKVEELNVVEEAEISEYKLNYRGNNLLARFNINESCFKQKKMKNFINWSWNWWFQTTIKTKTTTTSTITTTTIFYILNKLFCHQTNIAYVYK